MIANALKEVGRESKRRRKLPSELVVWLLIGMGLFRRENIETCLDKVVGVLGSTWGFAERPHSTSVTKARDRLGVDVIKLIFQKFAALLLGRFGALSRWHGFDLYTLDGSTLRAEDTPENEAAFGRPGTSRGKGKSAFPQLRVVMLVSAFTHVIVQVALGPYKDNEQKLAEQFVAALPLKALILLDRAYHSYVWPCRLMARKVEFLMRAKRGKKGVIASRKRTRLGRGDWLAVLMATENTRRKNPDLPSEIVVRQITRTKKGFRSVTVITSLLSPEEHSADEIFNLYRDRWEAELSLRELKTYLNAEWVTFRSHKPARVLQEAHGLFLAYNCTRGLMCEAAAERGVRPLELSFKRSLAVIRLFIGGHSRFPDDDTLVSAIGTCRLYRRRVGRSSPRAVKWKSSKFPAKRPGQKPARTHYQAQRAQYEARQLARSDH